MARENKTPLTEEQKALVAANLKLVGYVMSHTASTIVAHYGSDDDARSAGYVGLILAARRWDAQRGTKFTTYACHAIRNEMMRQAPYQQGLRHPCYIAGELGFCTPLEPLPEELPEPEPSARWDCVEERRRCLELFLQRHPRSRDGKLLRLVLDGRGKPEIAQALGVGIDRVNPLKARLFAQLRRLEAA